MAVETKIFLSKKKKTIMSEYRSPLVEPEPVPEPVKITESPVPEIVEEVNPEISKSAHSVESVKESDSSESDEEFSDCESEDEIQTDPRFFHSSVPCTHQVIPQNLLTNLIIYLYLFRHTISGSVIRNADFRGLSQILNLDGHHLSSLGHLINTRSIRLRTTSMERSLPVWERFLWLITEKFQFSVCLTDKLK